MQLNRPLLGLVLVVVAATAAGHLLGQAGGDPATYGLHAVAAPLYAVLGAVILPRRPGHPVGRLFAAVAVASAVTAVAAAFAALRPMAWVLEWSFPIALGLIPMIFLVYPDGRLPSPRWVWVRRLLAAAIVVAAVPLAWASWRHPGVLSDITGTVPADVDVAIAVTGVGYLLLVLGAAAAVASVGRRWAGSQGDERLQIEALALCAGGIPLALLLDFFFNIQWAWLAVGAAIPVAATIGILKYRLYDVDLVLNRSLVYTALTALVVGMYVAVVLGSAPLLADSGDQVSPVLATAVVAVAFGPARARIQRTVNRWLYGERDDPFEVVSRLSRRLEAAADHTPVLPRVAETVVEALRVPYAAVEVADGDGFRLVADHGRPGIDPTAYPMTYAGDVVGRLLVSPRAEGRSFSPAEDRLLRNLAAQAGMAAHAGTLTDDLRRSRERIVRSREEERRRLRRELHDGLGPALAGMTMQVGSARVLAAEHADVDAPLGHLEKGLQLCVREVRRIVDDLRPPELEQLGLVGALRAQAAAFAGADGSGLSVVVEAADDVNDLPAAVEIAAYRIAMEAVTNSVRHSGGHRCRVCLQTDGPMVVEVTDDGVGIPAEWEPGIGLLSMRERSEELGGALRVERRPDGGTLVRAELPLVAS
jgi:two-component system NarL family sensor kinase